MKKKIIFCAVIFSGLFLFAHKSLAAMYYASPSGSGSSCAVSAPCVLDIGVSKLIAGDTLYLRGGTYRQAVYIGQSGTAAAPITISGYAGETAVIDGYESIPGYWGILFSVAGSYVTVRDLEIKNSLWMGLRLSGTYDKAINIYSHDNWENGILITGDYGLADGCRVYNNAKSNVNCSNSRGNWASGLSCARNPSHCTLRNNTVWNNWGEGMSSYEARYSMLEDNVVYDNYSVNIYISDTSNTIARRNLIYSTGAIACGGAGVGLAISSEIGYENHDNTIVNNLLIGNKINFYYWYSNQGSQDGLINNVIAYNTLVNSASEVNFKLHPSPVHSNTVVKNNIVLQEDSLPVANVANIAGITYSYNNWSKIPSSGSGNGDVIGDSKLAKTGSTGAGQLTGDYFKLLSNSPAINKGTVMNGVIDDYFKTARGSSPDIGAHEYAAGSVTKKGDLNSDNKVDIIDLGILLSKWGPSAGSGQVADINLDGKVDIIDLGILLSNWG